ncbi:GNAT family N-acetyltransferase [Flavobacterium sp. WC2416]|uniref:GNAT family N-acetyltransferase n=1 Tax=Flavobacterium sp. WC2416 TaxID=3234141 RepID=A0AB39WCT3_9FLAO
MIKNLEWDSSFFNRSIGLLDLNSGSPNFEDLNDWDLIYIISDEDFNLEINKFINTYSETKVVFSKMIMDSKNIIDENISVAKKNDNKEQIYRLALESGKFSRFNLDTNFKKAEFKKLYHKWVDNSFNEGFADAVLVYKFENEIVGFVTYKLLDDIATIGLIAISPLYQGKGIGRKLINAVEIELVNRRIRELRIPTQFQNKIACEFYTKLGCKIIEKKIISHYWRI